MVDCYLGEIRLFAGPRQIDGWHDCDGTLLSVSENQALFSLLGTTWGGNGVNTFAIPNLQGSLPMGQGTGGGLSPRTLGTLLGSETISLTAAQLPAHNHTLNASSGDATTQQLSSNATLSKPTDGSMYYASASTGVTPTALTLADSSLSPDHPGGSVPHVNIMPGLGIRYIIATTGLYPTQN